MKRLLLLLAALCLLTACAAPTAESTALTLSRGSGVYPEGFLLTLSAPEGAVIRYTLDGSDPTGESALRYTDPIPIDTRAGEANVVSAVPPVDIGGSWNSPGKSGYNFVSQLSPPSDSAVDKCTHLRAAAQLPDGTWTPEQSAVYFIGTTEAHIPGLSDSCDAAGQPLAVISIAMDYADLFDTDRGIYVKGSIFRDALAEYLQTHSRLTDGETARSLDANYKQRGRAWEREATVTLLEFTPDGATTLLTQRCGIRIQGNYSRSDVQKGFRLIARSEYGDGKFRYPVFGSDYINDFSQVMDSFDSLVLRAGGNCAFTAKFNDIYWQTLSRDTACATKRSRPCVVYLNGEYWGLYVLEEDYTADYFESLHGVRKEDVVIYKGDAETYTIGYKLDEGEVPEGESVDYYFRPLLEFFATHEDLSSQEDYDAFTRLVDEESVMDYFAVQCWINNKWDWPGKNWSMWRTTTVDRANPYGDGRWRFIFYDMEFGGVSGQSDGRTNTIKEDNYKPQGLLDRSTSNPAVLCFAWLMTNEGFREEFCQRLSGLSDGLFRQETALGLLKQFQDTYAPLYDQFFARYPGTGSRSNAISGGYASISCIRSFIMLRPEHIEKQIDYIHRVYPE